MNRWVVLMKDGYDFEFAGYVEAKSARAARKAFIDGWKGPQWQVEPSRIKVSLVTGLGSTGNVAYLACNEPGMPRLNLQVRA